jgi:hypothetical protein
VAEEPKVVTRTGRKVNYLNNRDILKEIHKSKATYCTFLDKETIDSLIEEHKEAPHVRVLQKRLGEEVTVSVHGKEEYPIEINNNLFSFFAFDKVLVFQANQFIGLFACCNK